MHRRGLGEGVCRGAMLAWYDFAASREKPCLGSILEHETGFPFRYQSEVKPIGQVVA
jgi:hypothetical protein